MRRIKAIVLVIRKPSRIESPHGRPPLFAKSLEYSIYLARVGLRILSTTYLRFSFVYLWLRCQITYAKRMTLWGLNIAPVIRPAFTASTDD